MIVPVPVGPEMRLPLGSVTKVKFPINNRSPTDGEINELRPVSVKMVLPFWSNETWPAPVMFSVTLFVGSERFVKVPDWPGLVRIKPPLGRLITPRSAGDRNLNVKGADAGKNERLVYRARRSATTSVSA